jgi:hypothetical protein
MTIKEENHLWTVSYLAFQGNLLLTIKEYAKKLLTNLIQSLHSEPSGCEEANGRNPRLASSEGSPPLKPVLVEEVWDRVRSRLVPLSAGGTVPIRDF